MPKADVPSETPKQHESTILTPNAADDIEATPDFGGAPETQYILGLATIQGGVKILLNIEKIFLEDGTLSLPL